MLQTGDIFNIANFEIVAPSPCESVSDQGLVYQELQTTVSCDSLPGLNDSSNAQSPDHGYESDRSSSCSQFSLAMTSSHNEYPLMDARAVEFTCAATTISDSNLHFVDTSVMSQLFPLKLEEIDNILPWNEPQTFTEALEFVDDPGFMSILTPLQLDSMDETCSSRSTSESESISSNWSSNDSGAYASSSPCESTMDELEISESEDVECRVHLSPTRHDDAGNEKKRRRKRSSKQPILWKFLLAALNDPGTYDTMIHWVNKSEGTFQFTTHQKEALSQKWGEAKKNRCKMTYQKMARALRNYINRGEVLQKVKKKLQYTFIPEFYANIQHMVK